MRSSLRAQSGRTSFVFCSLTILGLLALAGCADSRPPADEAPSPKEALRLVIETNTETDPAAVKAQVDEHFRTDSRIEGLFPGPYPEGDPDRLGHYFIAEVPNARSPEQSEWDAAYELRDAAGFLVVEPDFENTLESPTEDAIARGTCLVGDEGAPQDKGWSLRNIHVDAAWQLEPPAGGKRFGEGVLICHPDTGWSEHLDLDHDRLALEHAANIIDGGQDATDPFEEGPLLNPGHGTGTGSVIVSVGGLEEPAGTTGPGEITGVAPAARLVPIRTAKSVIQVFDSDLARAIYHSVGSGCNVVSMSLGGRAFFGLRAAIRHAVRSQLIVAAAAGNCVRTVVAPAVYDECIAVAGTNIESKPWRGSSRGRAVVISAPAEHVWVARWNKPGAPVNQVAPGQGTSFAVANVAGVAALWLAYHGPEELATRYGDTTNLQQVFIDQAQESARVPDDWNENKFGAGIIDAEALLQVPLPDAAALTARLAAVPSETQLVLMARMLDRDVEQVEAAMAELLDVDAEDVETELERWGPELMQIWLENREEFERVLAGLEETAAEPEARALAARASLRPLASARLQQMMQ